MHVNKDGVLLDDLYLGHVAPSAAACIVYGSWSNGWTNWKNRDGESISMYRENSSTAHGDFEVSEE